MNHLAHCYLGDDSDLGLVSSLMGDFVKGRLDGLDYPETVMSGLRLHRKIDSMSDAHACVRRSVRRYDPLYRRYAGILTDVFYDHFLARNWQQYHPLPLPEFAQRVYAALDAHADLLPARLKRFRSYMLERDLLVNYREIDTINASLQGIASRLSRENPLGSAISQLETHYEGLERDFHDFFPDMVRMTKDES